MSGLQAISMHVSDDVYNSISLCVLNQIYPYVFMYTCIVLLLQVNRQTHDDITWSKFITGNISHVFSVLYKKENNVINLTKHYDTVDYKRLLSRP